MTLEKNIFIDHLTKSSTKIECANGDYLLAKGVGKIRLSCLKKDDSLSIITINDVIYVLKAKANMLSLGQLSKQGVDMKTTDTKMLLSKKQKTVLTRSRIHHI